MSFCLPLPPYVRGSTPVLNEDLGAPLFKTYTAAVTSIFDLSEESPEIAPLEDVETKLHNKEAVAQSPAAIVPGESEPSEEDRSQSSALKRIETVAKKARVTPTSKGYSKTKEVKVEKAASAPRRRYKVSVQEKDAQFPDSEIDIFRKFLEKNKSKDGRVDWDNLEDFMNKNGVKSSKIVKHLKS